MVKKVNLNLGFRGTRAARRTLAIFEYASRRKKEALRKGKP